MNWISVKDKLPENSDCVLLYNSAQLTCVVGCWYGRFGYMKNCFMATNGKSKNGIPDICWIEDVFTDKITHWMPLPKRPKDSD